MADQFPTPSSANLTDPFDNQDDLTQDTALAADWTALKPRLPASPKQKLKRLPVVGDDDEITAARPKPSPTPPPVSAKPDRRTEMLDAYNAWHKQQTPENMDVILKKMEPLIRQSISGWTASSGDPNLYGRAKLLAADALQTYDPQKGALSTHIIHSLQSLRRLRRNQQNIIRIPERLTQDYGTMREAIAKLSDELGREPNDQELADYTGFSPKRLAEIRRNRLPVNTGSLAAKTELSNSDANFAVSQDGARDALVWQNVYDEASPTEKKILEWSLGLNNQERLPNHVIADRLNVSPGLISQRKLRLQTKYDELSQLLWK